MRRRITLSPVEGTLLILLATLLGLSFWQSQRPQTPARLRYRDKDIARMRRVLIP